MKHFSKQVSWLLTFVLIFTTIGLADFSVIYASEKIEITTNTDQVILSGTKVSLPWTYWGGMRITYYESADSNTVLFEDNSYSESVIGPDDIAVKAYAWHISFDKELGGFNGSTQNPSTYCFKAYPAAPLENIPGGTHMILPEGTTLSTTTDAAIQVNIYVGNTGLTEYNEASSFTLPSASELRDDVDKDVVVDEEKFDKKLEDNVYKVPDLTKLYYTVDLTAKGVNSYNFKLTLVPTVEVTFNQNTGEPDLSETKMYATPKASIDSTKLPTVSLVGKDFYGWKHPNSSEYAYFANGTGDRPNVNTACELMAMYKEQKPSYKLDLTNKKVTNLLPNRTYAYPKYDFNEDYYTNTVKSDENGEFIYEGLSQFHPQIRLNSDNVDIYVNSDFVSLKHNKPNKPMTKAKTTTASVTNTNDFADCEFSIRKTSDNSDLSWGTSSTFEGLTSATEYKIYVRHKADEDGFESDQVESETFKTLAAKAVSNDAPNGVTIEAIPPQTHTGIAITPSLVIKDGDITLVKDTDYTVNYSDNINVGTATATVTFINKYSGTMTKSFEIAPVTYLVSFDGNGGTGEMSGESVIDGQHYELPACAFTAPANKAFKAWNIGGTEYAAGADYIVTAPTTIKAVWKDLEKVKMPTISPSGGTFSSSQTVTIVCDTKDAIVYYTTDGTEPTTGSTVYSAPFAINSSATVKAIAVKGGMMNSDIASKDFIKSVKPSSPSSSNTSSSSTSSSSTPSKEEKPTLSPANPPSNVVFVDSNNKAKLDDTRVASVNSKKEPLVVSRDKVDIVISQEALNQIIGKDGLNDKINVDIEFAPIARSGDIEKKLSKESNLAPIENEKVWVSLNMTTTSDSKAGQKVTDFTEPLILKFDLKGIEVKEPSKLTLVKYVENADGSVKIVKLGGKFDQATETFTSQVAETGNYGVMLASDQVKVNLQIENFETTVNDIKKVNDVAPQIIDSTTVVPLRFIAENLGAEVKWDSNTKSAIVVLDGKTIIVGEKEGSVNQNGRILVPLRYISENLGAHVLWIPSSKSIEIVK